MGSSMQDRLEFLHLLNINSTVLAVLQENRDTLHDFLGCGLWVASGPPKYPISYARYFRLARHSISAFRGLKIRGIIPYRHAITHHPQIPKTVFKIKGRAPERVVVEDEKGELRGSCESRREAAGEVIEGDAHVDQRGVDHTRIPADPLVGQCAQAVALHVERFQVGVRGQRAWDAACLNNAPDRLSVSLPASQFKRLMHRSQDRTDSGVHRVSRKESGPW